MATRSRSSWVRSQDADQLHAIAGKLRRDGADMDLSEGQEWLFVDICAELEWRASRVRRNLGRPCSCELCIPPFEDLY